MNIRSGRLAYSILCLGLAAMMLAASGCNQDVVSKPTAQGTPSFKLFWSEYPSWSTFGVAHELGIIDGEKGKQGSVETKWGVDIVLEEADYDTCVTAYAQGTGDAACLTNMDSLNPSFQRKTAFICPTSTSDKADALIVCTKAKDGSDTGVTTLSDLEGSEHTIYYLDKSVAQYNVIRNIQKAGKDPSNFKFANMDPQQIAMAMTTNQESVIAGGVWNPFKQSILTKRDGAVAVVDSGSIPKEIIDGLVIGQDTLAKEGGEDFACAIIDTFYEVNQRLGKAVQPGSKSSDLTDEQKQATVELARKFTDPPLTVDQMLICTTETRFFTDADAGIALFTDKDFQTATMPTVAKTILELQWIPSEPKIGFNDDQAQFNFTTKYMEKVKARQ